MSVLTDCSHNNSSFRDCILYGTNTSTNKEVEVSYTEARDG